MEFNETDLSSLVMCPFDSAHQVSRRKLQYHISKCIKTYRGTKVACPYNASEFIEPSNLSQHLVNCPSLWARLSHTFALKRGSLVSTKQTNNEILEAPFLHSDIPEPTESWGLE